MIILIFLIILVLLLLPLIILTFFVDIKWILGVIALLISLKLLKKR